MNTVPQLLAARAADQPDRTAIRTLGGEELTFGGWRRRSDAVARGLLAGGVRPGEPVGLVFGGRDWPAFAVACVGVQKAGAVAVPLAGSLPEAQLGRMLERCGATRVVRGPAAVAELEDGRDDAPLDTGPAPADLAQIVFTSGTAGDPKGVGASHANLTYGFRPRARHRPYAHSELFVHAFPIGTNAGQMMLMDSLTAHPAALALPMFDAETFCAQVAEHRAGTVFLIPPMAAELLRSRAYERHDLSCVLMVSSSAAALPPATAQALTRVFPAATVINCYISTESAPARTAMLVDPDRPGSLGLPADPRDVRILDPAGAEVPSGTVGEVWLRSPAPPRVYVGDHEGTAQTFRRDGWIRMGDLGHLDDEGYLYLADRESDVVKSGGLKVSTLQVEAALHEHPAVVEAAVVGVPHAVMGTVVAAAVRTSAEVSQGELKAFLAGRLARHERPVRIAFVDEFDRTTTGKIVKSRVRELLEK
ncbi:MAG TPA: class I adenylate-forming enzyme family protein [Pseudonocardia sp.]|nr:class I adenylate-forming enzyme family protein [Pseudonocardia sp.]